MKIIKRIVFIAFIIASNITAFGQARVFTLKEAIETALANNLNVNRSAILATNDSINFRQAKANLYPDLFGNVNQGIAQGRNIDPGTNSYINDKIVFGNYGISSNVTLFGGGQLKNLVKQNALNYQAGKMELQLAKESLTLDVILAYLQILNNKDLVTQSEKQIQLTQKQISRLEVLNKEGAVIPAQLYELRGQYANDEISLVTNRSGVESAKLVFSQLLNIPYSKDIEVEALSSLTSTEPYTTAPAVIYETSVRELSLVRAAMLRKESAVAGVKVAKAAYYPTVSLGGDLYTTYSSGASKAIFQNAVEVPSGDFVTINGIVTPVMTKRSNFTSQKINYTDQFVNNYGTSVNMNIRIPIFNAYQAKNRVAAAKNELKMRENDEAVTKVQLRQSIEQAYVNMTSSLERLKLLEKQLIDFEASYKIAEIRYNEGASNQVEYLIAKNNLERTQINLISAKYDHLLRVKILDYYQGKSAY